MRPKHERVEALDALRGVSALTVAAYHCREIGWMGLREARLSFAPWSIDWLLAWLSAPLSFGGIGVPIFFVLSGYVIHRRHAFGKALTLGAYGQRRFWRIYPVLLGALLLTLLVDSLGQYSGGHLKLRPLSVSDFVCTAASLQGTLCTPFGSNNPLWTLAVEVQLYAVYPLALFLWGRVRSETMLALTALASFATYPLLAVYGAAFFAPYWFCWWIGAYVADLEASDRLPRLSTALLLGLPALALGCWASRADSVFWSAQAWSVAAACLIARAYSLNLDSVGAFARRALTWLGQISYSLYATHYPVAILVSVVFFGSAKQETLGPAACMLAGAIVVAALFYFAVERPAMARLRAIKLRPERARP